MKDLLAQILLNNDELNDQEKSYDFLYQNFKNGVLDNLIDTEIVRLLGKLNLPVNKLLELASRHNHTDFVQFILNLSASSYIEHLNIKKVFFFRAGLIAAKHSNIQTLRYLLKILTEYDQNSTISKYLRNRIEYNDILFFTQFFKFIIELLEHLSDKKDLNYFGNTPYDYIKNFNKFEIISALSVIGNIEILKYFFNYTTEPDIRYQFLNNTGKNPVYKLLIKEGHLVTLKFLFGLLKNDKDILSQILAKDSLLPSYAAEEGNLEIFEYLIGFIPEKYKSKILFYNDNKIHELALASGNIDFIRYLMESTPKTIIESKIIATTKFLKLDHPGSFEILKYLMNFITNDQDKFNVISSSDYLMFSLATKGGRMEVVNYFLEIAFYHNKIQDMIFAKDGIAFVNAIKYGHINILKYLLQKEHDDNKIKEIVIKKWFYIAIENGEKDIVKFLLQLIPEHHSIKELIKPSKTIKELIKPSKKSPKNFKVDMINFAASIGHYDIFEYLIKIYHGKKYSENVLRGYIDSCLSSVFSNDCVDILKLFLAFDKDKKLLHKIFYRSLFKDSYFNYAIDNNRSKILRYFRYLGSKNKKIQELVIKDLRANDIYPLHGDVEDFDLYIFLHENVSLRIQDNQLFDKLFAAITFERFDVLDKLFEYRYLENKDEYLNVIPVSHAGSIYLKNVFKKNIKILVNYPRIGINNKRLLEYGFNENQSNFCNTIFCHAAMKGQLNALKYVYEKCPEEHKQFLLKPFIIKILPEKYYFNFAFAAALYFGRIEVLKYLMEIPQSTHDRNSMIYAGTDARLHMYKDKVTESCACLSFILDNVPQRLNELLTYKNFAAFRSAAKLGYVHIMKYLIEYSEQLKLEENIKEKISNLETDTEYTSLENIKEKMICAENYEAFRLSASNGRIAAMNYLLTIVDDKDSKIKMIHSNDNQVFKEAIKNDNIQIVELLLGSFLDQESNSKIIYPELEEAISNNSLVQYLGDVDSTVDWSFLSFHDM